MIEQIKEKYKKLKSENSNLDHEMVMTFIEEMPHEALALFDKMLYGCHIGTEEMYEKAVDLLEWVGNKGEGAKWSFADTVRLSGIDFDNKEYTEYDYAYVVNMLYSDYCNIFTESSYYLKMAKNYLEDPDYCGVASERAYHNAKKRIKYEKEQDK